MKEGNVTSRMRKENCNQIKCINGDFILLEPSAQLILSSSKFIGKLALDVATFVLLNKKSIAKNSFC